MSWRRYPCALMLALISVTALATIDLRTTIRDVYVDGTCEEAGVITFSVNGDDFSTASRTEPIYIRLRLDHAATLCRTLVWTADVNPDGLTRDPIFLPIRFEESLGGDNLAADRDTLSIVRWKKGEPDVWLKVITPTGTWIDNGGVMEPPSSNRRVRWSIGVTARTSWCENNMAFASGQANLPAATRDIAGFTQLDAVSTLICVDLNGSNLEPLPQPEQLSVLNFDPVTFGSPTVGVDGPVAATSPIFIFPGPSVQASYSGDTRIARGYDFDCALSTVGKRFPFPPTPLCSTPGAGQFGNDNFVACLTGEVRLRINCGAWGFHRNSLIHIQFPNEERYGFLVEQEEGEPLDGSAVDTVEPGRFVALKPSIFSSLPMTNPIAPRNSVRRIGGNYFAKEGMIRLAGPGVRGSIDVLLNLTVCADVASTKPGPVDLEISVFTSNRDDSFDVSPFDGEDQRLNCDQSFRHAGTVPWQLGEFSACESLDCARVFFPYLPKFFDTDFFASFSYVNHGLVDLTSVDVSIFESDGTLWTASLGPLPRRNQRSFTILYFFGNPILGNLELDTDFYRLENEEGDLVFGDARSSMFVTGCVFETNSLLAEGADLDGYMVLGDGSNFNGSYLGRIKEFGFNQSGDLPVLSGKKAVRFDTTRSEAALRALFADNP